MEQIEALGKPAMPLAACVYVTRMLHLSPTRTLQHDGPVWSAAFNPDGTKIVTRRLWRRDGEPLSDWLKPRAGVSHVAFSPDGSCFVTCNTNGAARLWSGVDACPLTDPLTHRGPVHHACFHPHDPWLATASEDKTVALWNYATGRAVGSSLKHPREVLRVTFSGDGKRLLAHCAGRKLAVWTIEGGAADALWLDHPARITTAEFSHDGCTVVSGCDDRWLRLWDTATGSLRERILRIDEGWFKGVWLWPDNISVSGAITLNTMKRKWSDLFLWDRQRRQFRYRCRIHDSSFHAAPAKSGRAILTGSWDYTLRLLRTTDGVDLASLAPHKSPVIGCAISPDESCLLSWSTDSTARLWELPDGIPA